LLIGQAAMQPTVSSVGPEKFSVEALIGASLASRSRQTARQSPPHQSAEEPTGPSSQNVGGPMNRKINSAKSDQAGANSRHDETEPSEGSGRTEACHDSCQRDEDRGRQHGVRTRKAGREHKWRVRHEMRPRTMDRDLENGIAEKS
jgi:hypothetical protein